jgi:hypothetical protein
MWEGHIDNDGKWLSNEKIEDFKTNIIDPYRDFRRYKLSGIVARDFNINVRYRLIEGLYYVNIAYVYANNISALLKYEITEKEFLKKIEKDIKSIESYREHVRPCI